MEYAFGHSVKHTGNVFVAVVSLLGDKLPKIRPNIDRNALSFFVFDDSSQVRFAVGHDNPVGVAVNHNNVILHGLYP